MAEQILGKVLHFKCDCLLHLDFTGTVQGYTLNDDEILFEVSDEERVITIGSNHPDLKVSEVSEI